MPPAVTSTSTHPPPNDAPAAEAEAKTPPAAAKSAPEADPKAQAAAPDPEAQAAAPEPAPPTDAPPPATPPAALDLTDAALYVHPEQSRLAFNVRVLKMAADPTVPLLERLNFLAIASTNLDEFFEVRFAGMIEQARYSLPTSSPEARTPDEVLAAISDDAHAMVAEQYRIASEEILPALDQEGIRVPRRSAWTPEQQAWLETTFIEQVMPVLTPTAIDPSHPMPPIQNKSLNFIISLRGKDAFGRRIGRAVVKAPRCLPRLIRIPDELATCPDELVMLSSVIHAQIEQLFPGMEVTGCHQFRVTRNGDLWIDEDAVEDLLHALRGQLPTREWGDAVRLEVADTCDPETTAMLLAEFGLEERDLYQVDGPVNLHRLRQLHTLVPRPHLLYQPFVPGLPARLTQGEDLFHLLTQRDVLLHHPYQSFRPVIDLARQAARDPEVLAIKQTVYRTGTDSEFVEALIEAARRGKEVTAVVELRARFDEAANIDLSERLRDAGVNVVYGVVGYKAHAKMLLIVRREDGRLRRYVHLGTGNYHAANARLYTDISFMSSDPELTEDVHHVFQQLTGLGKVIRHHKLLQAPFTLHETLLAHIQREVDNARAGKPARIMAKVNNLSENQLIRALYAASQAGVEIRLVVRSICSLRPGVPGVSDNIRVRSIVGRFLEHSRCYHFHADGEELTYLASADWMPRNCFRRVEVAWPITQRGLRRRVIRELLELPFEDNVNAWELGPDGNFTRCAPGEDEPRNTQRELVSELSALDSLDD